MKAMVLRNWVEKWGDDLKPETLPIPTPRLHVVLVKVKACGVRGMVNENKLFGRAAVAL